MKILEITECRQCKHLWTWGRECSKLKKQIGDFGKIPDWCPLPDVEENRDPLMGLGYSDGQREKMK